MIKFLKKEVDKWEGEKVLNMMNKEDVLLKMIMIKFLELGL